MPHVALLIEDDPVWAKLLSDLLLALGHQVILATTLEEARRAIDAGGYCYVLLDMEIPATTGMAPDVACGETALALLRKKHPHRRPDGRHVVQAIVITGYSNDGEFSSRLHQMDADAFIHKQSFQRPGYVADQVRSALLRAGRVEHEACGNGAAAVPAAPLPVALAALAALAAVAAPAGPRPPAVAPALLPTTMRLTIDARRAGRRVGLLVNGVRLRLPDQTFLFFLRLVVEHLRKPDAWHSMASLGFANNVILPSRLRTIFRPVVPEGFVVLEKNGMQAYRLNTALVVENVDWRALEEDEDQTLARVARDGARLQHP